MIIQLREFAPPDYEVIAEIYNTNYSNRPRTSETWMALDKDRNPKCKAQRWVACEQGKVVGFGGYDQDISDYHPQRFYLAFFVTPAHQRHGIGSALYDQTLAGLQAFEPRVLRANAFSTHLHGLHFLEKRGFYEAWRETPVQLDLAAFDSAAYAGLEERLAQDGIEIKTLRELEDDPDRNRKLYELYWQIYATLPREESEVSNMDFEDWLKWTMDEDQVCPDNYYIVTREDAYIGLKEMSLNTSDRTVLEGGLLGVLPEFRRRGIALALQVRANTDARDKGYRLIRSSTGSDNPPMQSLFDKLGYVHLYDWYQMEKRL